MEGSVIERIYNVNLRRGWLKAPKWKRAKRAVKELKDFIKRHMKVELVKIANEVNNFIWKRGMRKPPHHIKVRVVKKDNVAEVYLAEDQSSKSS